MKRIILLLVFCSLLTMAIPLPHAMADPSTFTVWIITDPHMGRNDSSYAGNPDDRDILRDILINQSSLIGDWDIALILGDITNDEKEFQFRYFKEIVDNLSTIGHKREDLYLIWGNHDANTTNGGVIGDGWFKYIDPAGTNPGTSGVNNSLRPFPIVNASNSYGDYAVKIGNTKLVLMSAHNGTYSGYDAEYQWWVNEVGNASPSENILCFSHHSIQNSGLTYTSYPIAGNFQTWLENHPGRVDAWFSGHTHYTHDYGTFLSTNWNTTFVLASGIDDADPARQCAAKSIVLTFTEGSDIVQVGDFYHGYSNFNYHNDTPQWDGNDTQRGNFTFTLDNAFNFSSSISVLDSATFTMEATVSQNETPSPSLTLLDSKVFTMSAVVWNESANNGSGFTIPPSSTPYYYVLAGMLAFFPFLAIVYKKWR